MPVSAPQSARIRYVPYCRSTTGDRLDLGQWTTRTFIPRADAASLATAWRLVASGKRHTQLNGPELLANLKDIALGGLGTRHTSDTVIAPARRALEFINKELGAVIWPDRTDFARKPAADQKNDLDIADSVLKLHPDLACPWLEEAKLAARSADGDVKAAGRCLLLHLIDLKAVSRDEVKDLLSDNQDRQRIDALLAEPPPAPGSISFRKVREVIALNNELKALSGREAGFKTGDVRSRLAQYSAYLTEAKKIDSTSLPAEAFIEENLTIEVADAGGSHLVQYQLVDYLGSGGMGRIFTARIVGEKDAQYIVKVLKPNDQMPELERFFLSEGHKIVQLRHPNIVKGYGLGEVRVLSGRPKQSFMVMDRHQTSLDRIMNRLTDEQKVYVAIKVAEGLNYAWNTPIGDSTVPGHTLHRDIKPENILIDMEGDRITAVKVADFGLSKSLSEIESSDDLTKTHMLMGTFSYLAPEMAELVGTPRAERGQKLEEAGCRTDIYALGIALYKMFNGAYPPGRDFAPGDGKIPHADWGVFARSKGIGTNYELKRPGNISPRLWGIIARAAEVDPAKRYQNWGELIRDLALYQKEQSSGYSLEVSIASILTPERSGADDASRLAKLVPEKDYTADAAGLAQAENDWILMDRLVRELEAHSPNDQHLPELRLNLLCIDLWITMNAPQIDADAKVRPLSVTDARKVIAEAETTVLSASPNIQFAQTQISRVQTTDKADGLADIFVRIGDGSYRPDAAEILVLDERIQKEIDVLGQRSALEEGDSLVVLQLTGYADILQAYIDKQGGE